MDERFFYSYRNNEKLIKNIFRLAHHFDLLSDVRDASCSRSGFSNELSPQRRTANSDVHSSQAVCNETPHWIDIKSSSGPAIVIDIHSTQYSAVST